MPYTVMLVEDHNMVREGLRSLVAKEDWLEVVSEAGDGRTALEKFEELKPDIVVMDLRMPGLNGLEATRRIKEESPETKIVALSVHTDKRMVLKMFQAGASAYVPKVSAFEELISAMKAVIKDEYYLSPTVAKPVLHHHLRHAIQEEPSEFSELTPREREVLQLVAEGMTSREIAEKLYVSVKTIDNHRQNIMKKLDLHSVSALTKYAIREGLTSLDDFNQ